VSNPPDLISTPEWNLSGPGGGPSCDGTTMITSTDQNYKVSGVDLGVCSDGAIYTVSILGDTTPTPTVYPPTTCGRCSCTLYTITTLRWAPTLTVDKVEA
jgi:hypothetical protein